MSRTRLALLAIPFMFACSGSRPVGQQKGDPPQTNGNPAPFPGDTVGAALVGEGPGAADLMGKHLGADGRGAIYVAGDIAGAATIAGVDLNGLGHGSTFLIGLDRRLKPEWARPIGGTHYHQTTSEVGDLAVDATTGDVVLAGTFTQHTDFGNGKLDAKGGIDGFVVRYSDVGALRWVRAFSSGGESLAHGLAIASDTIAVVGKSDEATVFGDHLSGYFMGILNTDGTPNQAWPFPHGATPQMMVTNAGDVVMLVQLPAGGVLRRYSAKSGSVRWEIPITAVVLDMLHCGTTISLLLRLQDTKSTIGDLALEGKSAATFVVTLNTDGKVLGSWATPGKPGETNAAACDMSGRIALAGVLSAESTIAGTLIRPSPEQYVVFAALFDADGQGLGAQVVGAFDRVEHDNGPLVWDMVFDGPNALLISASLGRDGFWAGDRITSGSLWPGGIARLSQ